MDKDLSEINANIENSHTVLERAWKNHAPQISENLGELGKVVTDRSIRKQWEPSTDVVRTNVLKRFKQFWGGSYLTRFKLGEVVYADLAYFRSLFLPSQISDISLEQSFFRINELWVEAQKAFFSRDMQLFSKLLLPLTQEIFQLRRMLELRERSMNHEGIFKSTIKRIFGKFRAR